MIQAAAQVFAALFIGVVILGAVVNVAGVIQHNARLYGRWGGRNAAIGAMPDLITIAMNLLWTGVLFVGGFWS